MLVLESLELYNLSQTQFETQRNNLLLSEYGGTIILIFFVCEPCCTSTVLFVCSADFLSLKQVFNTYKLISRLKLESKFLVMLRIFILLEMN